MEVDHLEMEKLDIQQSEDSTEPFSLDMNNLGKFQILPSSTSQEPPVEVSCLKVGPA